MLQTYTCSLLREFEKHEFILTQSADLNKFQLTLLTLMKTAWQLIESGGEEITVWMAEKECKG
jgi:hypothetical protein